MKNYFKLILLCMMFLSNSAIAVTTYGSMFVKTGVVELADKQQVIGGVSQDFVENSEYAYGLGFEYRFPSGWGGVIEIHERNISSTTDNFDTLILSFGLRKYFHVSNTLRPFLGFSVLGTENSTGDCITDCMGYAYSIGMEYILEQFDLDRTSVSLEYSYYDVDAITDKDQLYDVSGDGFFISLNIYFSAN